MPPLEFLQVTLHCQFQHSACGGCSAGYFSCSAENCLLRGRQRLRVTQLRACYASCCQGKTSMPMPKQCPLYVAFCNQDVAQRRGCYHLYDRRMVQTSPIQAQRHWLQRLTGQVPLPNQTALAALDSENERLRQKVKDLRSQLAATAHVPARKRSPRSASPSIPHPGSSDSFDTAVARTGARVVDQMKQALHGAQPFATDRLGVSVSSFGLPSSIPSFVSLPSVIQTIPQVHPGTSVVVGPPMKMATPPRFVSMPTPMCSTAPSNNNSSTPPVTAVTAPLVSLAPAPMIQTQVSR